MTADTRHQRGRRPARRQRYGRVVRITFEFADHPCPWGGRQPKFEHLATEGPARYFLVGQDAFDNPIRLEHTPGYYLQTEPEN